MNKHTHKYFLGIELGSTRIKAVLIDEMHVPVASGAHAWENKLENGFWTYSLDDVKSGIRQACSGLVADYKSKTGEMLTHVDGMGVSAMMHGYLVFDKEMQLLTPFRTWRNTNAAQAADKLTELFGFKIPLRWSIAHLYQAILDEEPHVSKIAFMTSLAGYVHYMLTGEKVLGVGDASGVFPVDSDKLSYDKPMQDKFLSLTGVNLANILPQVQNAGEIAGTLTESGAAYLDPTGTIKPGVPLCPPEGDAGTGMTATNSVAVRTGNVSAGTSVFAMLVMSQPPKNVHSEIDIVTTPHGKPVAMVHGNTCTSDIDAWVRLFGEAAELLGADFDDDKLYESLYRKSLEGKPCGGDMLSYNFYSGEPVAKVDDGCPVFLRSPESKLNLADFMRVQIYSAVAVLRIGMDILACKENVKADSLTGHGGFFKVKDVGQKLMASALGTPVDVMEQAGEGGAWGIALLAAYAVGGTGRTLEEYLSKSVFSGCKVNRTEPDKEDAAGFDVFIDRYKKGLQAAQNCAEVIK